MKHHSPMSPDTVVAVKVQFVFTVTGEGEEQLNPNAVAEPFSATTTFIRNYHVECPSSHTFALDAIVVHPK
jgi:hypothetical protein